MFRQLAAACTLLYALVQPAHAVIGIVIGDEDGTPGSTITVPVDFTGSESFYDFVIVIDYDADLLTPTGHAPLEVVTESWVGGSVEMVTDPDRSELVFTGRSDVSDHSTTYAGGLFEIDFEISADADIGETSTLFVTDATFTSVYGGEAVTVTSDGLVSVVSGAEDIGEGLGNSIALPNLSGAPGDTLFMDIQLTNDESLIAIDSHVLFDGSVMSIDRSIAPVLSDRSPTLGGLTTALTVDAEEVLLYDSVYIPAGDDDIIQVPITISPDAAPGLYELHWGMVSAYMDGLWDVPIEGIDGSLLVEYPDVDGDGYRADEDCDDEDPGVYPGAEELPGDAIDQDCDGVDAEADTPEVDDETDSEMDEEELPEDPGGVPEPEHAFQSTDEHASSDDKTGCACSAAPVGLSLPWVGLMALLGLRRRS